MFRFVLLAVIPLSFAQTLPALRWFQQVDSLGSDTFTGIGTDAHGNIYVAGNTISPSFPVKAAAQGSLGSAGLFRIDGSAFARLGTNTVVRALAADPGNPNVLYAVSSGAGVKSVDGGNTWTAPTIPSKQVQQFAVDPANDQNVYAAAFDLGFFKSTDGGATWNPINNGLTQCTDCGIAAGNLGAHRIWIDPNSSVLFAYYGVSLVRSGDGGATWQAIGPNTNGYNVYFEKPGVVYMFPSNYGPLKSTDDGQAFAGINIPVNSIFADSNQPRRLLGNGAGGVFESDDDGVTWTLALTTSDTIVAADFANRVLYASSLAGGVIQISSDLKTVTTVGPPNISSVGLIVSNGHVYVPGSGGRNVFVTKFDPLGNVIYSTYFGGSGDDPAAAMAVDAAGNVYVSGQVNTVGAATAYADFPTTKGAYSSTPGGIFLFKLNPDGSVGYSTYFPSGSSTAGAMAVDGAGSVYLTGSTNGGLPTTSGAYQAKCGCGVSSGLFFSVVETDAFLTKFDSSASTLIYSTYLGVGGAQGMAIAIGSDGSAYLGSGPLYSSDVVYQISATGSSLLASRPTINIGAMALAADGSLYVAGSPSINQFQPTAGAFQTTGPPTSLPYQSNGSAAMVKLDSKLQNVLAATYFGGPYGLGFKSLAVDTAGNVYAGGGSLPHGLPTRTQLFGAFGQSSGFLSEFSGDLSTLMFSTYLGDTEPFSVGGVALGAGGSVVIGGATSNNTFYGNIFLNSLSLVTPPALRIDAIQNAASVLDGALSAGETIVVRGAGFGSDVQLTIGDARVPVLSITATQITAVVPSSAAIGATTVEVQSGGATSNPVLVAVTATSPGLFSADGSGIGQGYIVNQDGTLNSPSNPAGLGQRITIYATGVGPVSFTDGFAVTAFPGSIFVEGFYCNGVAAVMGPVAGFPGSVYQLTVSLPTIASLVANNPDLKNFVFPPLVGLTLQIGGSTSQNALAISIAQ